MPQRLVTREDVLRHPEFAKKGISVNMYHDFGLENVIPPPQSISTGNYVHYEVIEEQTVDTGTPIKIPPPKVAAKKTDKKK